MGFRYFEVTIEPSMCVHMECTGAMIHGDIFYLNNVNNSYRKIETEMSFDWVAPRTNNKNKINNMNERTKQAQEGNKNKL